MPYIIVGMRVISVHCVKLDVRADFIQDPDYPLSPSRTIIGNERMHLIHDAYLGGCVRNFSDLAHV